MSRIVLSHSGAPSAPERGERAKLVAALRDRPGHVVVVGETAGDAAALFDEVAPEVIAHRTVRVDGRALDPAAAVATLWTDGGGTGRAWVRQRAGLAALVDGARAAGRPIVVAVADADAADAVRLERVRQALECSPEATEVVRIVLLGGPGLVETLRRREARSFATRVVAVVRTTSAGEPTPAQHRHRTRRAARYAEAAGLAAVGMLVAWMVGTPAAHRPPAPLPPPAIPAAPATPRDVPPPPAVAERVDLVPAPDPAMESPPEPAARTNDRALQVGAFVRPENAEALRRRLAERFDDVYVSAVERAGTTYHRVRVGGFASDDDRALAAAALRASGYAPIVPRD